MAYCHKCGSEVAESDAFCPFCGNSLKPVAVAVENESRRGAGFESSEARESAASFGVSRAKSIDADETETSSENLENANAETAEDDFLNRVQASDLPKTVDRKSAEADLFGNPLVSQSDSPKIPVASGENKNPVEAGNQNESSLMSYPETEVKEILEPDEEADASADAPSGEAEREEFVSTMPYIPPAFAGAKNAGENADVQNAQDSEQSKAAPIFDKYENPSASEQPVIEPEIESENTEIGSASPRFDSVQIRQPEKPSENPLEENPNDRESDVLLFAGSSAANPASSDSRAGKKEARSYTTPNIGGTNTDGKKSAKLKPLDEGTVLNGRYEIVRKIGGGGMGAVYLASDKNLGGVLRAVKEMVQSYIEDEQQQKAVSDFKRESMLLTSLEHQSIPTIYDYFFDEKEARFYLVMKYISGGDLSARLRSASEGRIDEKSVTEWGIQIADVLDYLHNRQPPIVYRDLKPANIMIDTNSGRAMLIDFGIARWVNKEEKGVTAVGTMGYAPPELFSGNVEPRSDIYSLGSTMFHLLTGADPQSNPLLIFDFQKHPRPRQINPQLSDQIEKILMRAVEYSADKRFNSAAEFRAELEKHLKNLRAGKVTFGVREVPNSIALSEQSVFCGFCGRKIVATDMFCAFCGAKQPLARQGVQSADYVSRAVTAKLLIVGTNELETPAFTIEKDDSLLGRRDPMSNIFPEVDLSKYDPQTKISRRHARLRREGNCFLIEDLGSSNGTVVIPVVKERLRLLPHQPYALTNGDKLKLGDTTLHFISG